MLDLRVLRGLQYCMQGQGRRLCVPALTPGAAQILRNYQVQNGTWSVSLGARGMF